MPGDDCLIGYPSMIYLHAFANVSYYPVFDTLILMNRAKDKATDRCRGDLWPFDFFWECSNIATFRLTLARG